MTESCLRSPDSRALPDWKTVSAVLLLLLAPACRPPAPEPVELRIGVICAFSGPLNERIGSYVREGIHLAIDQAKDLVVDGRRVRPTVSFEDSHDRAEGAVEAARKLIHQQEVAVLVGPCLSRNALAVAPIAEQQRIPMISPTSSHPDLTVDRRYVFRATIVDDLQGRALARFAREDLEARSAAVVYDIASAYNRGIAERFARDFRDSGGEIVASETYTTGERDFRGPLERIYEHQPDVLLLPNYVNEVPLQARQARELGITSVFLGPDAWDAEQYPLQALFEGAYFTDDWLPEVTDEIRAEETEFLDAYRGTYGRTPTSLSALAYDAVGVLLSAIGRHGIDGEAIRTGIAETIGYRGVTGELTYDGGDPAKSIGIYEIHNGRVSFVQRIRPRAQ